jgi:hypothetical protein
MPTLAEVRQKFPQYNDLPDDALADALHTKFYNDMPREEFDAKIGFEGQKPQKGAETYSGGFLPFSKDAEGNVSFDSNAGVVGAVKRSVMLPGDVMTGKVPMYGEDGRISDEVINRAGEAGMTLSPGSAGSRGVLNIPKGTQAPSAEALKEGAKKGFNAVRDSGVTYKSDSVAQFTGLLQQKLEQDGVIAELAPKTFSILNQLRSPPEGSVAGIQGLIAARRALGRAGKDFTNPTEQFAAKQLQDGLDQFILDADPKSVVSGPASLAARVQDEATQNYAAAKRSERLTGAGESAELRAAASNSGQNIDNAIRQRAAGIFLDPKKAAGYSAEELAAIKQVAEGTAGRNALRFVGNLLGGGGGLGAAMTGLGGAGAGSLVSPTAAVIGAGAPLVGIASRALANRSTRKALSAADELTRSRSPMAERMPQSVTQIQPGQRAAVGRSGMVAGEAQAVDPADMPKAQRDALMRGIMTDKSLSAKDRRYMIDLLNGKEI